MRIKWLGHASFLVESGGKTLITDPFAEPLGYSPYNGKVDLATVSHEHWDHNAVEVLKGNPNIVRETGVFDIDGFKIKGIGTFHDKSGGKDRGANTVYKIQAEGIKLFHLGDIGHILDARQLEEAGDIDVLMIPVGGVYTIDAGEAYELAQLLRPTIIIPMHFNTPHLSFELGPVEAFIEKFDRVIKKPYLELNPETLDKQAGVIVLDYLSWLTAQEEE